MAVFRTRREKRSIGDAVRLFPQNVNHHLAPRGLKTPSGALCELAFALRWASVAGAETPVGLSERSALRTA